MRERLNGQGRHTKGQSASGKVGTGIHWSADTTYTDVKNSSFTTEAALLLRKVAFGETAPAYRSNLAAGWANDKWSVDGYAHFVSTYNSYLGNVLELLKGYSSLAGRVSYRLPHKVEVSLNGQNLLHSRQSQAKGPSGLQAERRVMLGVVKSW